LSSILDTLFSLLLNFVLYGIVATIIVQIASEFIGSRVRFRMTLLKRRILKWIRNFKVELILTLKPKVGISGELENDRKLLVEKLSDRKIDSTASETSVKFTLVRNHTKAQGECFFSVDDEGKVDALEVVLRYPTEYPTFADDFQNLTDGMIYLEEAIRATFPEALEFDRSLSFSELRRLPESIGVLADNGLGTLSTRKGDIRLDFAGDTVTLYGKINADLRKLVQTIVAYYC